MSGTLNDSMCCNGLICLLGLLVVMLLLATTLSMGMNTQKGYYLADGIYPPWCTFVKSIKEPKTKKQCEFAKVQEATRKDIERAFGVYFGDLNNYCNLDDCCIVVLTFFLILQIIIPNMCICAKFR